ncbi:hypothetical protein BJ170DRAFT_688103 [Xylariales sp. AK1849]|nr:hypothetical protein BJ170DRAFT_688103 [Xylariales sp. AK1849]
MKLLSFLLLGSAAALPATPQPHGFTVQLLIARATPHSSMGQSVTHHLLDLDSCPLLDADLPHARYSFELSYSPQMIATNCHAAPDMIGTLVDIKRTACDDDRYNWAWTVEVDGTSDLELWYEYSLGEFWYTRYSIPKNQITWTNKQSPTGMVQAYTGPKPLAIPIGGEPGADGSG